MMLPGVELARKRRIHHHGGGQEGLASPSACRSTVVANPPTSMGESALLARRRLEEKLRGFGLGFGSSAAAATHSPTSASCRNPSGGELGAAAPRRAAPAARGTTANGVVATAGSKKKLPAAAAAAAAAAAGRSRAVLERVDSVGDECAVCLEGLRGREGRQVVNLPCAHRYHWDCVQPWLAAHPHCPCCRTPFPSS